LLKGTIEIYDASEAKIQLSTPGDALYYPNSGCIPAYVALKMTAVSGRLYERRRSEDFLLGQ
jgi:general stress protein 26